MEKEASEVACLMSFQPTSLLTKLLPANHSSTSNYLHLRAQIMLTSMLLQVAFSHLALTFSQTHTHKLIIFCASQKKEERNNETRASKIK